jgi:hypothetical protein
MRVQTAIRDLYLPIAAATGLTWSAHKALPSHIAATVSLSIVGMLGLHLLFSFTRFMIGLAIFVMMIKVWLYPFTTYVQTIAPNTVTPVPAQIPGPPAMHAPDPDDFEGLTMLNALRLRTSQGNPAGYALLRP